MLAQRQRELYSQQHRQQQLMQQRAMLMRQQNFSNNLPQQGGLPVNMVASRLPQGPPQQFPYPHSYGTNPVNPPPSTSPFSPLATTPEATLPNRTGAGRGGMVNRGMMGNVGGQFGNGINTQMQQNVFQYSTAGMSTILLLNLNLIKRTLPSYQHFNCVLSRHNNESYPKGKT